MVQDKHGIIQVTNAPVACREAIHEMLRAEFAAAEMVCMIENVFEDGEWAVMEWRDPLGLRVCWITWLASTSPCGIL